MFMNKLPVIAAVPNYNMGEQLKKLLPELLDAGYDAIYVLDDCSADNSHEIVKNISNKIHFIAGKINLGAGGNRNRILKILTEESTIHFLDADTRLETKNMAETVRKCLPRGDYGFIGGVVKTEQDLQSVWNYGPRQSFWSNIGAGVQYRIDNLLLVDNQKAIKLRKCYQNLLRDWPDPLAKPEPRQVFWTAESNMVVNSRIFKQLGGFDTRLREHEVQDLAIRMKKIGLNRYFEPSFTVSTKAVDVRSYNRPIAMLKSEFLIARKHGLRNWLLPDGKLKPNL